MLLSLSSVAAEKKREQLQHNFQPLRHTQIHPNTHAHTQTAHPAKSLGSQNECTEKHEDQTECKPKRVY